MKIIFLPLAQEDLKAIGTYISSDNPKRVYSYVQEITSYCRILEASPRLGREKKEIRPNLRCLTYQSYLIYYEIDGDNILILRILNAARDQEAFSKYDPQN